MFKRFDNVPLKYGKIKAPDDLLTCFQDRRYATAADQICRAGNFNQGFIFLSNCPEALSIYLKKCVDVVMKDFKENDQSIIDIGKQQEDINKTIEELATVPPSPKLNEQKANLAKQGEELSAKLENSKNYIKILKTRLQFYCALYLQIVIPVLTSIHDPDEHKAKTDEIVQFIKDHKEDLSKNAIYSIVRPTSDDNLLLACYHIFEDIADYCTLLIEFHRYQEIYTEMAALKPEERMKLFSAFQPNFIQTLLTQWSKAELPDLPSVYPLFCDIIFSTNPVLINLQPILIEVLARELKGMYLVSSPYMQVYFFLISQLSDVNKMKDFLEHPYFISAGGQEVNHDYLIRWLVHPNRRLYVFAGHICAHLPDRHEQAISWALQDSIPPTMDILTSVLRNAPDLKDCWIRALKYVPNTEEEKVAWKQLLETSTNSGVVALDDIFPLMPDEMGVEGFQGTILRSIQGYQDEASNSQAKIDQFIKRANEQRAIIAAGPSMRVELDALQSCAICGQSIYRDKFLVFPCLHTIHLKCLLSNMNLYWNATQRLNIISLAARAMKCEKNTNRLAEAVSECCPICGELSVEVLNKDFLLKEEYEERGMWALPTDNDENDEEEEVDENK